MSDKPKWTPGTYAVETGRTITIDGVPFVSLTRCLKPKVRGGGGYFTPVECDDFTRLAAAAPRMAEALICWTRGRATCPTANGRDLEAWEMARAALREAGL